MTPELLQTYVDEYVALYAEMKKIETRMGAIKPNITAGMLSLGPSSDVKIKTPLATMSLATRKQWTYPNEIVRAEELLEEEKKIAKQRGLATYTEGEPSLRCTLTAEYTKSITN